MPFPLPDSPDALLELQKIVASDLPAFWSNLAHEYIWMKPFSRILSGSMEQGNLRWFEDGATNICFNALDRHLPEKANHPALIWEPNSPGAPIQVFTYQTLWENVNKLAGSLINSGIRPGDRVGIYMPMIPETIMAMLACARIGAIHTVIFGGFSAQALSERLSDGACQLLITAQHIHRGEKTISLLPIVEQALTHCRTVTTVFIHQMPENYAIPRIKCRDMGREMSLFMDIVPCHASSSDDPLFILYTSGSTGKPKGILHSTGGYMVYAGYSFMQVFRPEPSDIFWCTADAGWITGHTYTVYAPLLNGLTTLIHEGTPTWPSSTRIWEIIEKHQVNILYTAPTAIRALMACGLDLPDNYSLTSLKTLGSVGEPINEEAWRWYDKKIGKGRCPVVDTWWQTETGGILISPIRGILAGQPCFATSPIPGIFPVLLDEHGQILSNNPEEGILAISHPWPGMAKSIWNAHERYLNQYFQGFPGFYVTGDGAKRDENGHYRITGRLDDVVNVSGHRIGTGEVEDAINEHPGIIETAIIGMNHPIKGEALMAFCIADPLHPHFDILEIRKIVSQKIGSFAAPDWVIPVNGLPKTRSGKIMRRILRKLAEGQIQNLGDTSTLLDPDLLSHIFQEIRKQYKP